MGNMLLHQVSPVAKFLYLRCLNSLFTSNYLNNYLLLGFFSNLNVVTNCPIFQQIEHVRNVDAANSIFILLFV